MLSMTTCEPGAVVLVNFLFSDQIRSKRRPAVIISTDAYHNSRLDALALAITSQTHRRFFGDCELRDWRQANLHRPSLTKGTIQLIHQAAINRRIGTLSENDYARVKDILRDILGL